MRTTILTKDKFGTQPALDDAQAAEVKAHSEVDQATAKLAYENQRLVVIQIDRMKVGDPVRVGVDTYPDRPICGYVEAGRLASCRVGVCAHPAG